ncbi:MAG: hypothetical protein ACFB10_22240 [Salibacteraceae bacterium]
MALYLILALLSAFRLTSNPSTALGVAFTFFILHLGYGLGYLQGIVRFLLLRQQPTKSSARLTR